MRIYMNGRELHIEATHEQLRELLDTIVQAAMHGEASTKPKHALDMSFNTVPIIVRVTDYAGRKVVE